MPGQPLAIAVELDGAGAHPGATRAAGAAVADPDRLRRAGEIAERAGATLVTLADDIVAPGDPSPRLGAIERAAYLAAATSVLGIAPVLSTTYSEPFHVASQLASLDHISTGRGGWVVGTSSGAAPARAWGRPQVADLAQEACDAIAVNRALWDSWADDAVIRDVASSRYLDRDRLHYIDFTGASYSIKGPAIVPRPPQGQLVVFAPDGSGDDADVTLVTGEDVGAVARAAGSTGTPRVFAELEVALDTAEASAADRLRDLDAAASWPASRLRYTGDAAGLIALLTELAAQVDGVRLHPAVLEDELAVLSQRVFPQLFLDRVAARPLPGATLRDHLGLPRPTNRFEERSA